ncbi:MAG: twin-arginine translocase subunit TatB [Piscirickettsiaceae bacterium]|nr:twin-arginine translocase subunit TatB [Piscirickettsiaceae bacterium]
MFDIGFWELLLIVIVASAVFGPERLPRLIRVIGLWFGRANHSIQSIHNEISRELLIEESKQALDNIVKPPRINEETSQIQGYMKHKDRDGHRRSS